MRSTLVLVILMLAGCPADSTDALVGTWHEVLTTVDTSQPEVLVVNADLTYSLTNSTGTQLGTYDVDGETLTIHSGSGTTAHELVEGYLVDGDQLLVGALFATGPVQGLVGAWHADAESDQNAITIDLALRADGSAHYARTSTADGDEAGDGTWSQAAGDLITTLTVGANTIALHWKAIDGRAIGNPMYERTR